MKKLILAMTVFTISPAFADDAPQADANQKVQYKASGPVDFEALLIKGQLKRPEISVVTGNVAQGGDGLLRIRKDFLDRVAADAGEENQ